MQSTPVAHLGRVVERRTKIVKGIVGLAQLLARAIFKAVVNVFFITFKETDGAVFCQKPNHGAKGAINAIAPLAVVLTGRQSAHRNTETDSGMPRRTRRENRSVTGSQAVGSSRRITAWL